MLRQKRPIDSESVAAVLWGSVWAGSGGLVIEVVLVGSVYLFYPDGRPLIEKHFSYVLVGAVLFFLAGFGMTLQSILEMQFRRGKWK
jgi:hypothetical protein